MPKTKISDVIVPEVFASYLSNKTKELSAIISSGIVRSSSQLDDLVSGGGRLINMPYWNDLAGDDEVLSDSTPLTPKKTTAGQDVAAMLIRGTAWSTNELAGALAGSDPMADIGSKVAAYRADKEQKSLMSVLKGVFASTSMSGHVNDIGSTKITAEAILDTKQLLGDAATQFTAIAMHSAVFTELQKQNLIEYIPNSRGEVGMPTYLGYKVIVDDDCPEDNGVYSTYLFANGAIARGDGTPVALTPIETSRDSLQGDDLLVTRWAVVLHPTGVKWTDAAVAGSTPSNAELADPANWERVYDDKEIGMAVLKHGI